MVIRGHARFGCGIAALCGLAFFAWLLMGLPAASAADRLPLRIAPINLSVLTEPEHEAFARAAIDRAAELGFNVIAVAHDRFPPVRYVDFRRTPYPEAQHFPVERVTAWREQLRRTLGYAKGKGLRTVTVSYEHFAPAKFFKAHESEFNPDGRWTNVFRVFPYFEKAMQGQYDFVGYLSWRNRLYKDFWVAAHKAMLDALPELDGFLNTYGEDAFEFDERKLPLSSTKVWKEAIDRDKTQQATQDYIRTCLALLREKRGSSGLFVLRDWYTPPSTFLDAACPRDGLVICVKFAGADAGPSAPPPWGIQLAQAGHRVIYEPNFFEAENTSPIYWFSAEYVRAVIENLAMADAHGLACWDFARYRPDTRDDPIRRLTLQAIGAALAGSPMRAEDCIKFLSPTYGPASQPVYDYVESAGAAMLEFPKLLPNWFWLGDGTTPGGLTLRRFWMLTDHPEAPKGMAWVRQDAVGVPEYVEYLRAGAERQRIVENEWRVNGRVPPPEILRRMDAATQKAKQSILAARTLAPKSPYMREMVASAFVLEYLTRRDSAFTKAAIAFSLSGGDLGYEKTPIKETGVNRKGEVVAMVQEVHDCDRMIRALAKRFCPRRPEMRPARDYYWERIVCKMMGGELALRGPIAGEVEAIARQISE